jgi:His/Glu/Gln/Arg/opine family amino acid ABC transporter permease subunit
VSVPLAVGPIARSHAPKAPDTRGATSRFAIVVLLIGGIALGLVFVGTLAIQVAHGVGGDAVTPSCVARGIIPFTPATPTRPAHGIEGAPGVCHIVEGLVSGTQDVVLLLAMGLGVAALIVGLGAYRRMNTRRKRDHVVTGAVLGSQALVFAVGLWLFAHGTPEKFVLQFLNFNVLKGNDAQALVRGVKYTLLLALGGEFGGIAIGLVLALLTISTRRAVRAPARVYINVFRGTPLLMQLSIGYFGVNLGLGLHLGVFAVAVVVLALNMGAYSAEVFRAGIQSIERGQLEAARSVGMTYLQAMRYAIMPQAIRRVIPPLMNEFVILIKDTSLVIILGLPLQQLDLFGAAQQGYSDTFSATYFVAASVGYLIVTLPMIRIVNAVERRLHSGLVSVAGAL